MAGNRTTDADVHTCIAKGAPSCLACVRIKPKKPPHDSGVRCVWCRALGACRGYIKGTSFPCADAVRGGGGYPGGAKCTPTPAGAATAAAAGGSSSSVGNSRRAMQAGSSSALLTPPPLSLAGSGNDSPLDGVSLGSTSSTTSVGGLLRVEPLWFSSAAKGIAEAMPLGNGRLGAIVYGGAWRDSIGLNEESIVAGPALTVSEVSRDMRAHAGSARGMEAAMAKGDIRAAERAAAGIAAGKVHSYEFLGSIGLELAPSACITGDGEAGGASGGGLRCARPPAVSAYRRQLDLESALASVSFTAGACGFERHAIISSVDDVLVLRLNASCEFDALINLERRDERSNGAQAAVRAKPSAAHL